MKLKLDGFDHIHVYVSDRDRAARWYQEVLGFRVCEALLVWAEDPQGPLTLEDSSGVIHLALFAQTNPVAASTVAFKVSGEGFLCWRTYLEQKDLSPRLADHKISWSLYFSDIDNNQYEITTYDYKTVQDQLR